ncbi:MAG: sigma-E processing peptidase SpoIIGA [Clostridia bacterium]|nr:sigma-E processing peptidase SpoIIGA [Clostridia bacterium]
MPVIYLDILIAVNLVIDYLLLLATARILRLTPKRVRVLFGGLFGGVSACMIFLTTAPTLLLLVLHFASACILIKITFPFSKVSVFLKQVLVFYVISALFSGLVSVLWSLTKSEVFYAYNGVVYFDISPLTLTFFAVVSYAIIHLYEYITRKRAPFGYVFMLRIDDGNGICECRALYDTGMHLTEPFSGKPVIIVEQGVIGPYLSQEHKAVLCYADQPAEAVCTRVRVIPYRSLGEEGLLPAFVPRCLTIESNDSKRHDISGTYVALSNSLGRGGYQALVGSDVMEGWA